MKSNNDNEDIHGNRRFFLHVNILCGIYALFVAYMLFKGGSYHANNAFVGSFVGLALAIALMITNYFRGKKSSYQQRMAWGNKEMDVEEKSMYGNMLLYEMYIDLTLIAFCIAIVFAGILGFIPYMLEGYIIYVIFGMPFTYMFITSWLGYIYSK